MSTSLEALLADWSSELRGPSIRELHHLMRERDEEYRREREGMWTMPDAGKPDPADLPEDPDVLDQELLEILLCPACDMELRAPVCSPVHALLQDNPLQHRLLVPLVERMVTQLRHDETKLCTICPSHPPIATGDCTHITDRHGQIWMSKKEWLKLIDSLANTRSELAGLVEMHEAYMEAVREERVRIEDHRAHWAAEWAEEKFERMCADPDWDGQEPSLGFRATFSQMLHEDR